MQACIHRGTKEIGGTCIELLSQGKRLVLDVGLPLNAGNPKNFPLPPVPGFLSEDNQLLGVLISHPHQDHYGLGQRLPPATNFLIGKAAERILSSSTTFSSSGLKIGKVIHLEDGLQIPLGPFKVTPFLVDHSAYDSYAVLIEADGRKLFYTGDFRAHGRKQTITNRLIENPPKGVNALIMEGTCLGREDKRFPTEPALEPFFVDIFEKTPGMALVWCSGQNIDRLVTVYKACCKAGRDLILDMYTADILHSAGNHRLPQADWNRIRVFLPSSQKYQIQKAKAYDVANRNRAFRIFPEKLKEVAHKSVMLFRPSMTRNLEIADCLEGSSITCSVWRGYLGTEQNQWFVQWIKKMGLPLHFCHTSGHASIPDLQRMRQAFADAPVIPVHLEDQNLFKQKFPNVRLHQDGEWWEV